MSTEKHQLRVDVIGHTVVGGHCVANNGWHNEGGGIVVHSIPTAFHQGTKSGKEHTMNHQIDPTNPRCVSELPFLPAILCQRQDVTFVFDAGHAVHVLVSGRKNLILQGKEVVFYCCLPTDYWKYQQILRRLHVCTRPAAFNAPLSHASLLNPQYCYCSRRAAMM